MRSWTLCWVAAIACGLVTRPAAGSKVKPPAYLMDLYEKFSTDGAAEGTAVHALLPVRGLIEGEAMQVFNLTGVHRQEVLRHAQLHVHRRLLPSRGRAGSLRLRVCEIATERVPVLEDIVLNLNSTGWQTFDVSAPVRLVLDSPQPVHLLGLRVEIKRPGSDDFRPVRWRRMRRMHLQPFIVAFTDDAFSMEEDIEHNYLHVPGLATVAPHGGDLVSKPVVTSSGEFGSSSNRVRRSVADNSLSPTDEGYYRYNLVGSDENNIAVFSHHSDVEPGTEGSSSAQTDPSLIPYPPKQKHKKRRRRKHKKRKHRRRKMFRNRQLPTKWNFTKPNVTEGASAGASAATTSPSGCRRHRLTVDFDAIGWGDWIINPQRFDAFYCAGACAFPLSKESRPTNHATIQSLAAMLGVKTNSGSGVPAPCCVPDVMDSLTLLYFDETRQNVVLKNYPKMVVKSCSCR